MMTDEEKSIVLAKVMLWSVLETAFVLPPHLSGEHSIVSGRNLYNIGNFKYSFFVMNWFNEFVAHGGMEGRAIDHEMIVACFNRHDLPVAEWLRGWLDAIVNMILDSDAFSELIN